jgi:hypothetical protein
MELKIEGKNKIGIVAGMILIILLTQNKSFNFLINNNLGRLILILLIITISNFNILLSIIFILFIVILINKNDEVYLEGFDTNQSTTALSSSLAAANFYNVGGNSTKQGGREGFNIIENERNILLGKKSKEISINPELGKSSENTQPFNS